MGDRAGNLQPGERLWAPSTLQWDADSTEWVEFRVIRAVLVEPLRHFVDVTVERDGARATHRLDAELGVCIIEEGS